MNKDLSPVTAIVIIVIVALALVTYSGQENRKAYYACLKTQEQIASSPAFKDRQLVYVPDCKK